MAVGIDLVELKHIKNEELLAKKILSKNEFEIYSKRVKKLEYLASRFAVKEAFIKAKKSSILGIDLRLIEVLNYDNGAPYIKYNGEIYENISLSHESDYAVAIVII